MSVPMFRIGVIAKHVGRKTNTIHKWETFGYIAEPMMRSGERVSHRVYTKGEVVLIVKAHRVWWREHYEKLVGVSHPNANRFAQIYWDMRKYLLPDPNNSVNLILTLPPDYKLPPKISFSPDKEYIREGKTFTRCIYETGCRIRDSVGLRKQLKRAEIRREFMSRVYLSTTKEEMKSIIEQYEEIVKNAEAN